MRTLSLLVLVILACCSAEPAPEGEPDAAPTFCSPLIEECGYCGVEDHGCCLNKHGRPEDTRPQYYCIDGSKCTNTNTNWPFMCVPPSGGAPAPGAAR